MTKNEKREHGDVLYEAILTLKDLDCLLYTSHTGALPCGVIWYCFVC